MKPYSRKYLDFLLNDVFKVSDLCHSSYFKEHSSETFSLALDMTEDLSDRYLGPHLASSDRIVPEVKNGKVEVNPAIKSFIKAAADSGITGATLKFENGGQQLPKTVFGAMEHIQMTQHNSFVMYTDLVNGCTGLIEEFGTEDQKNTFLPNMLSTKWLGTMCLTEPQAGSGLSDLKTKAIANADGTYNIEGQKIFISAGDHDLSENIIHLVLARVEGSPEGTKGISLFIVPKFDLHSGLSNDVTSIAAIHKMGQKATPAMHLAFGASQNCKGQLLGELNKGLLCMFQMMNAARLGVGMTGVSIAATSYYNSLQYAHERVQGKPLTGGKTSIKIIEHPDVRRMLLHQKAIAEGGLAFMLQCYMYLDFEKTKPDQKDKYLALAELLTPVAKSFGAEMGIEAANMGIQVLGGYGYTEDFIQEQLLRDARICSIYEGTTAIHGLAVLGREIMGSKAQVLEIWMSEINLTLHASKNIARLEPLSKDLQTYLDDFKALTLRLLSESSSGKLSQVLGNATPYLEAFAYINIAWVLLKVNLEAYANHSISDLEKDSYFQTVSYYYQYILSRVKGIQHTLNQHDLGLTQFEPGRELIF